MIILEKEEYSCTFLASFGNCRLYISLTYVLCNEVRHSNLYLVFFVVEYYFL